MQYDIEKCEQTQAELSAKKAKLIAEYELILHGKNRVDAAIKKEERKKRTRRLIERGAIFESLVPNADKLTNEQVLSLLKIVLQTNTAIYLINKMLQENSDLQHFPSA